MHQAYLHDKQHPNRALLVTAKFGNANACASNSKKRNEINNSNQYQIKVVPSMIVQCSQIPVNPVSCVELARTRGFKHHVKPYERTRITNSVSDGTFNRELQIMRVALFIVLYIEQTNVLNVIYNTKHIARSHSVQTLGARRSRNINGTARCLCGCVFGSVGWLCVSCASVLCCCQC